LAIADKALLHIESLEDLLEIEIPAGQDEMELMFKDSVLDLPTLRKCTKGKGTTEEPMPKHAFTQILRAMLRKAGYFAGATIHAIRRFLGKKVDGKPLSSKLLSSTCSFLWKTGSIRACRLADVLVKRNIRKCSVLST
jgi:hypothetical protein